MRTETQIPLIERLMSYSTKTVNPHEVARELTNLHSSRNVEGVRKLRDAYLVGLGRSQPIQHVDRIRSVVDGNLMTAAGLADEVASCGYEASGQLLVEPKLDGPIAKFYQEATGYKPK